MKKYVVNEQGIQNLINLINEIETKGKFIVPVLNFISTQLLLAELPDETEAKKKSETKASAEEVKSKNKK